MHDLAWFFQETPQAHITRLEARIAELETGANTPLWGASTLGELDAALGDAHELSGPPHERIQMLIQQRDEARSKAAEAAPVAVGNAKKDSVTLEQIEQWAALAGFTPATFTETTFERLGDFAIFARAELALQAVPLQMGKQAGWCFPSRGRTRFVDFWDTVQKEIADVMVPVYYASDAMKKEST